MLKFLNGHKLDHFCFNFIYHGNIYILPYFAVIIRNSNFGVFSGNDVIPDDLQN